MMTYLPKPNESSFVPPPAGSFPAVCYRILDLGTQQTSYKGQPRKSHKILVSWELKDEEAVTDDGFPMSVHQQYTWSMHEKAALRRDLESWRGKKFTDADFGTDGFNIKKLLGVPCFLGIVHDEKEGNTYANISAISKLPKNMTVGETINPLTHSWLEPGLFDKAVFAELSDRLQEKIKASPEYQLLMNGAPEHVIDADRNASPTHPAFDDEIPF